MTQEAVEVVHLENDYLKATFIPGLGGRLWSLYDKVARRQLLYVNDVIRPSNLAVRNAWVSGGVEWNIGVIGHSPYTCDQLFVGVVEVEGMEVLRMYEYERIRKVTYQMDFFLPEDSKFLMCRMRIVNPNKEEVPMYWWSNMAVPELEKGRLVVDANSAYTNKAGSVYKVGVPIVEGVDISRPKQIPNSVDYFFDIAKERRKYITQLDESGYGMIQTSTSRLQGRKLFVWGQTKGSSRWQSYLTQQAGPYIEIQAGLAKTQYGCLPMEAESTWEWLEGYGAIQVESTLVQGDWYTLRKAVGDALEDSLKAKDLEVYLEETRESIALLPAHLVQTGSVFGAIENRRRKIALESPLSIHLDFGIVAKKNEWVQLLTKGTLGRTWADEKRTISYMADETYFRLLQRAVEKKDKDNSYTWYQLGLIYLVRKQIDEGIACFKQAQDLEVHPFIKHALAVAHSLKEERTLATTYSIEAIWLMPNNKGLVKDCIGILMACEAYGPLLEVCEALPAQIKQNTRVKISRAHAHAQLGQIEEAKALLKSEDGWIEVEDIREGDAFTSTLWEGIASTIEGKQEENTLPDALDFRAIL
ncbi:MAG: DUF5107 domain-containing protein [Niameybacter sp.]